VNRVSSRGWEKRKQERDREREGMLQPPPNSPLGHFTLCQLLLGLSSCGQTLLAGACSQASLPCTVIIYPIGTAI